MLGLANRGRGTTGVTQPYLIHLDFPMINDFNAKYCLVFSINLAVMLEVRIVSESHEKTLLRVSTFYLQVTLNTGILVTWCKNK